MTIRSPLAILLAGAALFATACGSGSTSETTTSTATTTPVSVAATSTPTPVTTLPPANPRLPVTVQDKDGKPVTVTDVSRVVVLNGEIVEIMYALGLGSRVAGVDISATYPPEAKALPSIGYQRALAAEGILALKPTLIIGNENAGPASAIEQLRAAGVPVLITKYSATIEDVPEKIRSVARALGVEDTGAALADRTKGEIDSARTLAATAKSRPRVAFLNVRGGGTQQVWGKGTPADAMIAAANATNAAADAGITGSKPITAEAMVTAAPDVILLASAALGDVGGMDGVLSLPGIGQTPAGKSRAVVDFEDQYLLGMGPRTGQALRDLVKALHPSLR